MLCNIIVIPDLGGEIIHVGRGENSSVNDIIDAVESTWDTKINREYVDMRPGEVHVEIALDPTKLKELLDYELQWDLESGLKETFGYYENAHKKYSESLV